MWIKIYAKDLAWFKWFEIFLKDYGWYETKPVAEKLPEHSNGFRAQELHSNWMGYSVMLSDWFKLEATHMLRMSLSFRLVKKLHCVFKILISLAFFSAWPHQYLSTRNLFSHFSLRVIHKFRLVFDCSGVASWSTRGSFAHDIIGPNRWPVNSSVSFTRFVSSSYKIKSPLKRIFPSRNIIHFLWFQFLSYQKL